MCNRSQRSGARSRTRCWRVRLLVSPSSLVSAACSQMPVRTISDYERLRRYIEDELGVALACSRDYLERRFGYLMHATAAALDAKYSAITEQLLTARDMLEVKEAVAEMQAVMARLQAVVADVVSQIADLKDSPCKRVDIDLSRLLGTPESPSIPIELTPEEWQEIVKTLDYSAAGSPEKEAESPPPPMAHQPGFSGGAVSATGSHTVYASLSAHCASHDHTRACYTPPLLHTTCTCLRPCAAHVRTGRPTSPTSRRPRPS